MSFHRFMSPYCSLAIFERLSPRFTVYIRAELGAVDEPPPVTSEKSSGIGVPRLGNRRADAARAARRRSGAGAYLLLTSNSTVRGAALPTTTTTLYFPGAQVAVRESFSSVASGPSALTCVVSTLSTVPAGFDQVAITGTSVPLPSVVTDTWKSSRRPTWIIVESTSL